MRKCEVSENIINIVAHCLLFSSMAQDRAQIQRRVVNPCLFRLRKSFNSI